MIKEEPQWKRELMNLIGFSAMFLGIIFIISSKIITTTGNSVIESIIKQQFSTIGIILFIGGMVVLIARGGVSELEREAEGDEAHSVMSLLGLRTRLGYMEEQGLIGSRLEMPRGVYLSEKDEEGIRDIIIKYLKKASGEGEFSQELLKRDIEISVFGSLSQARKGRRHGIKGSVQDNKGWEIPEMKSDEFYVSDVDVSIAGKGIFDYIIAKWPTAVMPKGEGKMSGKTTFKVTSPDYLTRRDRKQGYMERAPKWVGEMVSELNDYTREHGLAGINDRPINVKFFRDKELVEGGKDVLYSD